jgi:hypothetical protein
MLLDRPGRYFTAAPALASCLMSDEKQDQDRTDRDHARSEEAHWRVAEAGAEEDRRSENQQDDPEKASGAADREPEGE